MSEPATTISLESVSLRFPTTRVTLGSIERSFLRMFGVGVRSEPTYTALDNVSLEVKRGEVIGLVGRNGAGKSTMLRVIAGIYRPDSGVARKAGRVSLLAGLGVGFNVNLSGRENAYIYGAILGHHRQLIDSLMEQIIEFSGLAQFIDQPLRTYSNGMRARLGFSIASAIRPEILLIDEVLAVGDEDFKQKSKERIQSMMGEAGTVLLASHSAGLIKQICTRAILVDRGRITMDGPPADVIAHYLGDDKKKSTAAATATAPRSKATAAG